MSDYDVSDYDVSDYDVSDYDVSDYDVSDYDVSDYDVSDYDVSDYDVSDYDFFTQVDFDVQLFMGCHYWSENWYNLTCSFSTVTLGLGGIREHLSILSAVFVIVYCLLKNNAPRNRSIEN